MGTDRSAWLSEGKNACPRVLTPLPCEREHEGMFTSLLVATSVLGLSWLAMALAVVHPHEH